MNKKLQPLVLAGMIFANTLVPIGQVFADDEDKAKKINNIKQIENTNSNIDMNKNNTENSEKSDIKQENVVEVNSEKALLNAIKDNANIKLTDDIELSKLLDIRKNNVTIDGNSHTIKPSDTLDTSNKNFITVRQNGNKIENLTLEGYDDASAAILAYNTKDLTLENITCKGTSSQSKAGIDISGSKNATLKDISTSSHYQAGIRLKNGSDVTLKGINTHDNDSNQLLLDNTKLNTLYDNDQYVQDETKAKASGHNVYYSIGERTIVKNEDELINALKESNKKVVLGDDIKLTQNIEICKDCSNKVITGLKLIGNDHVIDCNEDYKITFKSSQTKISDLIFKDYLNSGLVIYGGKNIELKGITFEGNSLILEDGTLRPNVDRSKVGLDIAKKSTVVLDKITCKNNLQKGIFVRGGSTVTLKSQPKHVNDTVHMQTAKASNEDENTIKLEGGNYYIKEDPVKDSKGIETTNSYTKEVIPINSLNDFINNSRNCGTILNLNKDITLDDSVSAILKKLDSYPSSQYDNTEGLERDLGLNILQNIDIEGNGHTIDLRNICGIVLKGNDSIVNDLNVENSSGNGISVYNSKGVKLNKVKVENSTKSGIVANGSIVDLKDCETVNNGECGVMSTRSKTLDNPNNPEAYRDSIVNIGGSFETKESNVSMIIKNIEMIKSEQDNKICFKESDIADNYKEIDKPETKAKLNRMIVKDLFEEDNKYFIKVQTKLNVAEKNPSGIVLDNTGETDNTEKLKELLKYAALNSKELYFPKGIYKISDDIDLAKLDTAAFSNVTITGDKDGLSILDASSVNDKIVLIKNNDYHARMGCVNVNNMVFENVGLDFNGVYKNDISLNNNVFLNGRCSIVDGKAIMTPYITVDNSSYSIKSNIFLRGKEYAGRGISTYATTDSLIKDNFFGKLESEDKASKMLPSEVIDKIDLLSTDETLKLSGEQGNFLTCINNERHDKNMTIQNNYMHMNDSREIEGIPKNALISGIDVEKDGQRKDHIIYSKGYDGLNIVGNYFEGMENGAAGGVKLRNGEGAYVGSNYFKEVPLLTYIYKDLTKEECILHDTTIYNNVFDETNNMDKDCTGILYYQNFNNGETVTFPDGTVDSNVQGDIKNFIVYKNRFLSNEDSLITISNKAKDYEDQFYVKGNIYDRLSY